MVLNIPVALKLLQIQLVKLVLNFNKIYGISQAKYQIGFDEFVKFIKSDDVNIVKINIEKAIQSDKNTDFEFRIVKSDGEIRYIKAFCKIVKDNKTNKKEVIFKSFDI